LLAVSLRLKHFRRPVWAEFDLQAVEQSGWLDQLPDQATKYLKPTEYQALLRALEVCDFELDFCQPEPGHLSFAQLIDCLDQLRIGRPSTLGAILQAMEHSDMLVIKGDEVRLTAAAYLALHTMQQRYPAMASKHFSTRLALLQQKLEHDSISIQSALAELLPDLLRRPDAAALSVAIWDDIESLYSTVNDEPQAPVQGLIRHRAGGES
jgi:DNA topoisomerase IA